MTPQEIVDSLKRQVDEKKFIDVGRNVVEDLPVSETVFRAALAVLKDEGYQVHYLRVRQLGNDKKVAHKVLVGPDVTQKDTYINRKNIHLADFTQL